MRIAVLASGSSGNSIVIQSGGTSVLVDAGLSARRTLGCLEGMGIDPRALDALLITHEHEDHVRGAGPLVRGLGLPVYATAGTLDAIGERLGPDCTRVTVRVGTALSLGSFRISPFSVSHDSADPVGFSVGNGRCRLAIATDLGAVGDAARRHLSCADCVVLEFNHDERMLLEGPYPWHLKERILSGRGHLSNGDASREIVRLARGPLSTLILAHLSAENNTPELALAAATDAFREAGVEGVSVVVSSQDASSGPLSIASAGRFEDGERELEGVLT